jgi:hypothetical protein
VPGPAVVDVERRIAAAIEAHRPELEQLVDDSLDGALDRLVVERLAPRNGDVPGPREHLRDLVEAAPLAGANLWHLVPCLGGGDRALPGRFCNRCLGRRRRERRALAAVSLIAINLPPVPFAVLAGRRGDADPDRRRPSKPARPGPVRDAPKSPRTSPGQPAIPGRRRESGLAPGVPYRVGVSAAELLERAGHGDSLDARELERWLLAKQLADRHAVMVEIDRNRPCRLRSNASVTEPTEQKARTKSGTCSIANSEMSRPHASISRLRNASTRKPIAQPASSTVRGALPRGCEQAVDAGPERDLRGPAEPVARLAAVDDDPARELVGSRGMARTSPRPCPLRAPR